MDVEEGSADNRDRRGRQTDPQPSLPATQTHPSLHPAGLLLVFTFSGPLRGAPSRPPLAGSLVSDGCDFAGDSVAMRLRKEPGEREAMSPTASRTAGLGLGRSCEPRF